MFFAPTLKADLGEEHGVFPKWQRIEQEQTTLHMEVHSIFGLTKWWNDAYLLLRETLCLKTNSCSGKCSVDNTPRLVSKKCQVNLSMMIYDSGQASDCLSFLHLATVLLKRSRTPWVKIWRHDRDNPWLNGFHSLLNDEACLAGPKNVELGTPFWRCWNAESSHRHRHYHHHHHHHHHHDHHHQYHQYSN